MAQTTMTANPGAALSGTFASSLDSANEVIYKRASEAIAPGRLVVIGAADDTECDLANATGEVTGGRALGVSLIDRQSTSTNYAINDMVRIAVAGEVWVDVEEAVTAGGEAFVRFTDAGALGLGAFRSDADTADAIGLPNARYASTTAGAGIAKVTLGVGAFI
jgi:hypothetical protein